MIDRGWSGVWVGCWYHSSKHPTMRLQHASYPDCFTCSVRKRRCSGLMGGVVREYSCLVVTVSGSSWEHAGCSACGTLGTIISDCPHWQHSRSLFFLSRLICFVDDFYDLHLYIEIFNGYMLWMIQLNHKDSIRTPSVPAVMTPVGGAVTH